MRPAVVFGARPNFMKVAPLHRAMAARPEFDPMLVHTGQHFDAVMSDDCMEALELPTPDVCLGVGPGTQAAQIAAVMGRLEPVLREAEPDASVVVGDVSSTLAAALTSATLDIPVAHVEAGLRSGDWQMPEERNRVLTDRLSHWLFTPSGDADDNLAAEGIDAERVFCVGNVMMDSLDWVLPRLSVGRIRRSFGVASGPYGLVTLHRPGNVDDPRVLRGIISALVAVARDLPLLFPVHPRTRQRLRDFGIDAGAPGVRVLPPIPYDVFVALLSACSLVMTDSGGIQEEATALGAACVTLRDTTERPITMEYGRNRLVGSDPERIVEAARGCIADGPPPPARPPLWDGKAAHRIVDILAECA
ncbi:MAG: UDP-N-acetylglucosamine 2-epimerase (non-hydrolyzing) [Actinomycetota bacterium]|nr:UDP-N-acetylglucosamine 2-epimerase (non-hydrolyzing) [Actinomycetota bacterium]